MKSSCSSPLVVLAILVACVSANTIRIGGGHKRTSHHIGQRYANPHVETIKNYMDPIEIGDISPADPNDFPYFVDLDGTCGGSLIARRVVLTAAHCIEKWYRQNQVVVDPKGENVTRTVIATESHPDFDPASNQCDFQLYLLDEPVADLPVTLFLKDDDDWPSEGAKLVAMGVGQHNDDSTIYNFELTLSNFEQCQTTWDGVDESLVFCAALGSEQDQGQSLEGGGGGPIVVRSGDTHVQVGILSSGGLESTESSGLNNLYARTSAAMSWIEEVVCEDWGVEGNFCQE